LFEHFSGAQTVVVVYFWQAPAPSHLPFVPHEELPWSVQVAWGSAPLAATGVQRPSDEVSAHDTQAPVQAVLQQTPSAHRPLAQSPPAAHVWPFCLGPQLPFTQACPLTQSALLVHRLMHAPSAQR
jgi:hypothetical protein